LSDGVYDKACESFETVLGLVERVEDSERSDSEAVRLRSQAHLGSGLAKLLSGEVETAISILETGLEEMTGSSSFVKTQLTVLLAQTMWMLGTEEAHEAAKSVLLDRYGSRFAL